MKSLLKNRKGQGTAEYMLILAIVVLLALAIGQGSLKKAITEKVDSISQMITSGHG